MTAPVGISSYNDGSSTSPHGQMQYVASQAVADQVASLCYEYTEQVGNISGDQLTVNEGIRSRERQLALYNAYRAGAGALAANPYTSTHDPSRGSALDFGITDANGNNRALTTAEFAWLHGNAPRRGIQWTGSTFNPVEQWHHNGGYAASETPIPDVPLPGENDMTQAQFDALNARFDNIEKILAKDTFGKVTGGIRGALAGVQATATNIENIIARDSGGGIRAVVNEIETQEAAEGKK